jgi:V8-like Glu-specific endopeptidase
MANVLTKSLTISLSVLSMGTIASEPTPKVVYGADDRLEVFEASPSMKALSMSTAAMVPIHNMNRNKNATYILSQKLLKERGICEDDPYANQPTAANCSGFLIGPDLLVTAGHCVRSQAECEQNRWVFDYKVDEKTMSAGLDVSSDNVYSCKLLVNQELSSFKGTDHALIQLDRVVKDRLPLSYRSEGAAEQGDPIVVIGHPMGLPTKIAGGANIRTNTHPHFFVANLDTFGGNSGSAVFNTNTLAVEGILVRGETDYKFNPDKMCAEIFYCADEECRGEDVSRITSIIELNKRDVVLEAALSGNMEVLANYVSARGWVNMYDNSKESLLMKAAQGQQLAVVELLIQGRLEVDAIDLKGQSALHHLALNKELSESGIKIGEKLLAAKARINLQDFKGETPLMKAAAARNVEMVRLLVESGADVRIVDQAGRDVLSRVGFMGKKQRAIRRIIRKAFIK